MELWRLVAHRHWLTIRFREWELRVCARCSGYFVGFFFTALQHYIEALFLSTLTVQGQLLLCSSLTMPLALDWLTQSRGWRESNNALRFITGAVLGSGVSLYSSINLISPLKTFIYVLTAVIIVLFGILESRSAPKTNIFD